MENLNTYIVTRMIDGAVKRLTILARNPGDASRKADAYMAGAAR